MSSTSDFSAFSTRLRAYMRTTGAARGGSDSTGAADGFDRLAQELFWLQCGANGPYRRFCQARGVTPENVTHWSEIPALPTAAFKEAEVSSLPERARTVVFHSSGTTEQRPSRNFHSRESLAVYEASLLPWFIRHLLPDPQAGVPTKAERTELVVL